jgi:hypothetical protein
LTLAAWAFAAPLLQSHVARADLGKNDYAVTLGYWGSDLQGNLFDSVPNDVAEARRSYQDRVAPVLQHWGCDSAIYSRDLWHPSENHSLAALAGLAYQGSCGVGASGNDLTAASRWDLIDEQLLLLTAEGESLGSTVDDTFLGVHIVQTGELDAALKDLMPLQLDPTFRTRIPKSYWHLRELIRNNVGGTKPFDVDVHGFNAAKVPETENHLLMMQSEKFLSNQMSIEDPEFGERNIPYNALVRETLLSMFQGILSTDFFEYNAKPYHRYSRDALLNLAQYASDSAVANGARLVLDFLAAKYAVTQNLLRTTGPFRRRLAGDNNYLLNSEQSCEMYVYSGQMQEISTYGDGSAAGASNRYAMTTNCNNAIRPAISSYRVPNLILDMFMQHTNTIEYSQTFHGGPTYFVRPPFDREAPANGGEPLGGTSEYYYNNGSYLLAAGGVPAPHGLGVRIAGKATAGYSDSTDDVGLALRTVLIPNTPSQHAIPNNTNLSLRDQMVRIEGLQPGGTYAYNQANLCAAPGFACGYDPRLGADPPAIGWHFGEIAAEPHRIYVATYAESWRTTGDNFPVGFFVAEIESARYPTRDRWEAEVRAQNPRDHILSRTFSGWSGNYKNPVDGGVLHFNVWDIQTLDHGKYGNYPSWYNSYPITSSRGNLPPTNTDTWGLASGPITAAHDALITITNPRTDEQCVLDMRDRYNPTTNCKTDNDSDGDSVPDAQDNCPSVKNGGQANCNEVAELASIARGTPVRILGDACDPVPCPFAKMPVVHTSILRQVEGDNKGPGFRDVRTIADQINLTTVGSHVADRLAGAGTAVTVPSVQTEYRFCQSNVALQIRCNSPSILQDSMRKNGTNAASEAPQSAALPWHRITVRVGRNLLPRPNRDNVVDPLNYGSSAVQRTWDYTSDYRFWTSLGLIPQTDPDYLATCNDSNFGVGTCLKGRLWIHAGTDVGSGSSLVGGVQVGLHGSDLANFYVNSTPDEASIEPLRGYGNPREIWIWQTLSDPYTGDPALFNPAQSHEAVVLGAIGTGERREAVGFSRGRVFDTRGFMSPGVRGAMTADLAQFVGSTDPGRALNLVHDHPVAVLLAHDGTRIADTVELDDTGLVLNSERRLQQSHVLGEIGANTTHALNVSTLPEPAPRVDSLAVYSALVGRVFVLGGVDSSTGLPRPDLWSYDLSSGAWRMLSGSLHRPLAATYSFDDGKLWVLDGASGPRQQDRSHLRLIRIDAETGESQEMATLPGAVNDRRSLTGDGNAYLSTAEDGSILLATSRPAERGERQGHYMVARIAFKKGRLRATLLSSSPGQIIAAPIVDQGGIGYLLRDTRGEISFVDATAAYHAEHERQVAPGQYRPEDEAPEYVCRGMFQ